MGKLKQIVRGILPRKVRNWVRSPQKSLTWSWHKFQFLIGVRETIEMRPGWNIVCHPLAYNLVYNAHRQYPDQVEELDSFISHCHEGMVLFDLGAHFGMFSLAAVHYGGPDTRALAVDASPTATKMIECQAKLNEVNQQLHIVQACVGDTAGVKEMVDVGVIADGYFILPDEDHNGSETTAISGETIDSLVKKTGWNPTHIKIDVEGFEHAVLRGGVDTLQKDVPPILFLELHNRIIRERGEEPGDVLDLLVSYGYLVKDFHQQSISREAILQRDLIRFVAHPNT